MDVSIAMIPETAIVSLMFLSKIGRITGVFLLICLAGLPANAAAVPLIDGDFSAGTFGTSDLPGWSVLSPSGSIALQSDTAFNVPAGGYDHPILTFGAGETTNAGSITQAFQIDPSINYALSFDAGALATHGNGAWKLDVTASIGSSDQQAIENMGVLPPGGDVSEMSFVVLGEATGDQGKDLALIMSGAGEVSTDGRSVRDLISTVEQRVNCLPRCPNEYLALRFSSDQSTTTSVEGLLANISVSPVAAPEIDPASAASGMTLLALCLFLAIDRRRLTMQHSIRRDLKRV